MVCRFLGVGSGFVTGFLSGRISRQFLSEIFSQPRQGVPEGGIPRGTMPLFMCLKVKPSNYSTKQKAVIFSASPNLSGGIMPYSIKSRINMRKFSQHCWMMWAGWCHKVHHPLSCFFLFMFHFRSEKQKRQVVILSHFLSFFLFENIVRCHLFCCSLTC